MNRLAGLFGSIRMNRLKITAHKLIAAIRLTIPGNSSDS